MPHVKSHEGETPEEPDQEQNSLHQPVQGEQLNISYSSAVQVACSVNMIAQPMQLYILSLAQTRSLLSFYASSANADTSFLWRVQVACSVFMLAQPMQLHSFSGAVQVACSVFMLGPPMQLHSFSDAVQVACPVFMLAHPCFNILSLAQSG